MSEAERGAVRAEGALNDFLFDMKTELEFKDRSAEYRAEFWNQMAKEFALRI